MLIDHGGDLFTATTQLRLTGMQLPIAMTVVRLPDGRLWLLSPITPDAGLLEAVAAKGEVAYIVAPNSFHHLFVQPWAARFPDAQLWASPGLREKRPDLAFAGIHGDGREPWSDAIASIAIAGAPKVGETVFFHRASRTLVVTELLFNIHRTEGFFTPWILRMMGVYRRLGQSRVWRLLTKDRSAAAASARAVLGLGAQRVVFAHGDVIDALPEGELERALSWMLAGAPALTAAA